MNDLRFAVRLLRSSPAFSLSALVVLSLGIGANGAMFALIDAVLLKPLPVAEPDRLVVLTYVEPGSRDTGYSFSYPAYVDLRDGGVVRDGKYVDMREEETPRFVYVPFLQAPSAGEMVLHARTDGDPFRYVDAIRQQLRAVDATLPLSNITTLEQQIDESLASERILATLGAAFGALALLLAAVGVYGVLAFSVARRTREMGVRMALGASPADVARLVLTQVARVLVIGLAAGTFGAWGAQRAARSLLFEVSPGDPSVWLTAVLLVTLTAGLAALFPAWRAARLNPLSALRHD